MVGTNEDGSFQVAQLEKIVPKGVRIRNDGTLAVDPVRVIQGARDSVAKSEAAAAASANFVLAPGESSVFAANVERYMQKEGLKPVNANGIISAAENTALTAHLKKIVGNKASGLQGQVALAGDGSITFTPKALSLLEIDPPKAAAGAPAAAQGTAAGAPAASASTTAPSLELPADAASAATATGSFLKRLGSGIGSAASDIADCAKDSSLPKCITNTPRATPGEGR